MAKDKMQRTVIEISYDGSFFFGWQRQKDDISIQASVENVLEKLFCRHTTVHGSGRTDAGVHAVGQVAHFNRPAEFETEKLITALNSLLPPEIRITKIADVDSDFHSRFSAEAKKYTYIINTNAVQTPFSGRYSLHFDQPIKLEIISKALDRLNGEKDFKHFTTPNAVGKTSIREILKTSLVHKSGFIYISITANGFLRYMMRAIMGTILKLAQGKISFDQLETALNGEKIKPLPITLKADPNGLFLVRVYYKNDPFKEGIKLPTGLMRWDLITERDKWE